MYCPGGTIADASTDEQGQTQWTAELLAGLCDEDAGLPNEEGLLVVINGSPLTQDPLPYHFNSADMNGDLAVDLTDIVLFAQVYFGAYDYCADYYWDGVVNLSDIVLLAQGNGAECP